MTLKEEIQADCLDIEADLENPSFIWDSETYLCFHNGEGNELDLETGGFSEARTVKLFVRTNQFADNVFPQSQDRITFNSSAYRIANAKKDPTGALLVLTCVSTDKGA